MVHVLVILLLTNTGLGFQLLLARIEKSESSELLIGLRKYLHTVQLVSVFVFYVIILINTINVEISDDHPPFLMMDIAWIYQTEHFTQWT